MQNQGLVAGIVLLLVALIASARRLSVLGMKLWRGSELFGANRRCLVNKQPAHLASQLSRAQTELVQEEAKFEYAERSMIEASFIPRHHFIPIAD